MIVVLAREYRFPLESIGRDVPIMTEQAGKKRRKRADLVVFEPDQPHELEHAIRIIVVRAQSAKPNDRSAARSPRGTAPGGVCVEAFDPPGRLTRPPGPLQHLGRVRR